MSRFDWYQGTIHEIDPVVVISSINRDLELTDLRPCNPHNGYSHGVEFVRGSSVIASAFYGGNKGVNVKGTGDNSPVVASAVKRFEHRVTRVDSCTDWKEPGLFDKITKSLIDYAEPLRVKINLQGDWVRGESRTLYLGSRSSSGQLVVYEKGYQASGDLNWVRLEARAYPKGSSGYVVASWLPVDVYGCTRWMAGAMKAIGWDHIKARSIGTVWKPSDSERARAALIRQYGNTLKSWADDAGSYQKLGSEIGLKLEPETTE